MKLLQVLPWAAASAALVLPEASVFDQIAIEQRPEHHQPKQPVSELPSTSELLDDARSTFDKAFERSRRTIDRAWDSLEESAEELAERFNTPTVEQIFAPHHDNDDDDEDDDGHHGHHPHKPHRPHKPHKPHKPTKTIWELISDSKYTTKLAATIAEYPELVDTLNSTKANYTLFAPTDKAFEKIPKHAPKPSKEDIARALALHVVPAFYPAGRVLVSHTAPTLLDGEHLSEDPKKTPQRIGFHLGFKGLTVNYYSRIVAIDIFATNGVIHGIDSILVPPPNALDVVTYFPGEFSTLELALVKTDLFDALNDTSKHLGGTFFAPSNLAWKSLGPRLNAFLFSSHGRKYLRALLEYHAVSNETLYSDAYYTATEDATTDGHHKIPKGIFHVDLPTLLKDRSLSIDIARFGGLIDVRINGYVNVAHQDGIARDGVIQVLHSVLIPPKRLSSGELQAWEGESLSVQDLKERLAPFVEGADENVADEPELLPVEDDLSWDL